MNLKIIWKLFIATVLSIFGYILITSTNLFYSSNLSSEVSKFYIENISLTGAINCVSAILLDFRAYDTLGEILVIFVTISGVVFLVGGKK